MQRVRVGGPHGLWQTPRTAEDGSIAFLEKEFRQLQQDIDDHIDRHPSLKEGLALLASIPAVVPVERQSGTSLRGRPRLSKAGPAMRKLVHLCFGAIKTWVHR